MIIDPINSAVNAVESVLNGASRPIALHAPTFNGREWAYVKECLDTGWVSSAGPFVDEFERRLTEKTGAEHAVPIVNGTSALHVGFVAIGIEAGDEVLAPALTFVATCNAIVHAGALPHFVDCENVSLGVDANKLNAYLNEISVADGRGGIRNRSTGNRIRALVAMHAFGHACDLDALLAVCQNYGIELVEDAAESLGSSYKGRHVGTFGRFGILSFNGNKTITTGGGGAVLTMDQELAARVRHLSTTAKRPHKYEFFHDEIAYNYRMPNLNAALGCAQLEQLDTFLKQKRMLAAAYREAFAQTPGVRFFDEPPHGISNFWLCSILFDKPDFEVRNQFLDRMAAAQIMARPAWNLMTALPMFADCPRMPLPASEEAVARLVCLPSSPFLSKALK